MKEFIQMENGDLIDKALNEIDKLLDEKESEEDQKILLATKVHIQTLKKLG